MNREDLINAVTQEVIKAMQNSPKAEYDGEIKVGVSQRHIHLSREDLEKLLEDTYKLYF